MNLILTIIKDEQLYLDEFIRYHLDLGIDHILIFEDVDSSSHKDIVEEYPQEKVSLIGILDIFETQEEKDEVLYKKSHLIKLQQHYLRKALNYVKSHYDCQWCFAIDIDEYITLEKKTEALTDVLNKFKDYDAVLLQWESYGANGLVYMPDYKEKGIINTYTQPMENQRIGTPLSLVKVVYNMKTYTSETFKSHHYPYEKVVWCKTNFSQDKESFIYDNIYLRHYTTKSWEEFVIKLNIRGMFYPGHRNLESFFYMNPDMLDQKEKLLNIANEIIEKRKTARL